MSQSWPNRGSPFAGSHTALASLTVDGRAIVNGNASPVARDLNSGVILLVGRHE